MPPRDPVPRWVRIAYRLLLTEPCRGDLLRDLARDVERRGLSQRAIRHAWHLVQILSPATLSLAVRLRLRRSGPRGRSGLLWADLRQATKGLGRDPGFATAVVGSLGLGIGITVAVLSVAHGVLMRPPPYEDPASLVFVWNSLEGFESNRLPLSGIQVAALREESAVFEDVAAIWATTRTASLGTASALLPSAIITPNFFDLLGLPMLLGPGFSEESGADGANPVLVSHGFWQTQLGSSEDVVGRSLQVDGEPATIVGVVPGDVRLTFPADVGVPTTVDLYQVYPWVAAGNPSGPRFLRTVARLVEGVGLGTAGPAAEAVSDRLRREHEHMASAGDRFRAVSLTLDSTRWVRPILLTLVAGALFFLLLTCVNVTSLFMARRAARSHELVVRQSLGATLSALFRLQLFEAAILTGVGLVVGIIAGGIGLDLLWGVRPEVLSRMGEVGLEGSVVLAVAAATGLIGLAAVTAPLLTAGLPDGPAVLRSAATVGDGLTTRRRGLVVAEVALSMVLVACSVLLGASLTSMQRVDLGFRAERVGTFRVGISPRSFPEDHERARLAWDVREAVSEIPGVERVGAISHIPMADWANWVGNAPPGSAAKPRRADTSSTIDPYCQAISRRWEPP